MAATRQRCFVIMPFSGTSKEHTTRYWTKHFKSFLKPLIEEHLALEACRSQPLRGDLVNQIIKDLVVSPVVVADLTDGNPNVYWELGIRQSFKHCTITIAEEGTKLPSDIGAKGTLFYHPKDHLKGAEFRSDFKEAIQDCLDYPHRPDSRVLEAISGRGTLFQVFQRDEAMRRLDAVLSECESNLQFFDLFIENTKKNQEYRLEGTQEALEKIIFPTLRMRSLALELLIAHRYVDEEPAFYEAGEHAHNWIVAISRMSDHWIGNPESVEQWMLPQEKAYSKILKDLRKRVLGAREKISKVL